MAADGQLEVKCNACDGTGWSTDRCRRCGGTGRLMSHLTEQGVLVYARLSRRKWKLTPLGLTLIAPLIFMLTTVADDNVSGPVAFIRIVSALAFIVGWCYLFEEKDTF